MTRTSPGGWITKPSWAPTEVWTENFLILSQRLSKLGQFLRLFFLYVISLFFQWLVVVVINYLLYRRTIGRCWQFNWYNGIGENSHVSNINPVSANPTKWSKTFKNSSATAGKLFECVGPFCGVGASRVKKFSSQYYHLILPRIFRRKKKSVHF